MIIATKYFGQMECSDEAVILFSCGLPGFEELRNFVCLERPATRPLVYLQSVDQPDLCFLMLSVRSIYPDYDLVVSPEDRQALGCNGSESLSLDSDVACLAIVAFSGEAPTANLLAPVVINHQKRVGAQLVQFESSYSHCHPLNPASEQVAC